MDEKRMPPIRDIEWEIAKGKVLENQKNAELANEFGISHENNVSRIYSRFIEKIEQTEKDLLQAIELGLYTPMWLDIIGLYTPMWLDIKKKSEPTPLSDYVDKQISNTISD
ncbi:MAG: hypothetical protein ACXABI_17180 [Candidatus Hodarchaeales archaeon]|jgi:hypothetical protein